MYQRPQRTIKLHKRIVEKGGGQYVAGMMFDLILFNSPTTGSTLAIPRKKLTVKAVREKIAESDKTFAEAHQ